MTREDPAAVAESIRDMPAWAGVSVGDEDRLAAVEAAVKELCCADVDIEATLAGMERFVEDERAEHGGLNVSAASKVYVLNRCLFAVPEWVPADRPRFGSFLGVPDDGDRVNERWPWDRTADGDLRLTGYFRGYAGETYQPVEEAAAFRRRYGPRD